MSESDKAKEFEQYKNQIYDLEQKKMKDFATLKPLLSSIGQTYKNGKTNRPMSILNVWSVAKRYGIDKNYISKGSSNKKISSEENVDPEFVLTPTQASLITNPKNGIWIVDISNEESLQQKSSKNVYQKGMVAALRLEFFRVHECSCQIEFRNIKSIDKELYAFAYCKECPGEIEYQTFSGRKLLRIMVSKFKLDAKHSNRKSKLTGGLKTKVLQMLEADQPGIVQSKLANEMISNFGNQNPLVPHKRSLRQIKYRNKKHLFRDPNPVLSICKMKNESKYYKCIEDIGISPFFVYYTTPLQRVFVKSESQKNTTKISIDATGCSAQLSPEAEISERTGKKKRCFFYNMMLHGTEKTISVYQMLSQTHSSQKITDWLLTWKNRHNNQRNPIEVRMDESAALILSAVTSFTSCKSVHEYLSQCYEHLMDRKNVPRPSSYIRLDPSHVVATIYRNATFKKVFGKRTGPKSFYLRIIGYLLQEADIEKAEKVIRNSFRIAYNRFSENIESGLLEKMNDLISTHKNDFNVSDDDEKDHESMPDTNFWEEKSEFHKFIKKIALEEEALAKENNKVSGRFKIEDAYYAVDIVPELIKIYSKLPMSGCLLNKSFGLALDDVPTSSQIEANFRVINNDLFAGKKRIRIDKWLEIHLLYLIGETKANNTGAYEILSDEETEKFLDLFIKPSSSKAVVPSGESEDDIEYDTNFETESENSYQIEKTKDEIEPKSKIIVKKGGFTVEKCDKNSKSSHQNQIKKSPVTQKNTAESFESEKKNDSYDEKVKQEPWKGQNDEAKNPKKS